MYNIIGQRKYFYIFSGILIILSVISLSTWGLKYGIDFTGGTLMEVKGEKTKVESGELKNSLKEIGIEDAVITPAQNGSFLIRYGNSDDEKNKAVLEKLKEKYPEIKNTRLDYIGPSISSELKRKAVWALGIAIVGIALYIAYAFRKVSRPVESWKYGVGAVVALVHDILITVGIFSALGHFLNVEVDTTFIAALLTILGFSVHDTIVVYDRTRENLLRGSSKEEFSETVNRSLNETMARSINTSLTVIITLLAVFIFGGETIKNFTLALLIGITFGTYSSIFVASALMVDWWKWEKTKN
ncbi:MAG: protein-export membrane protein SecF [Candidatus Moranbacteria bacterium RIFOXYB1_FULL_43_19]|nr:MAG: protein-export membrane protein SecF [Candidatus Moranbacteria bacterium RIFOXYB1_FULL_43_19]OGI28168.1 MAG: protein-export membrane protein SecF [Candidatus Moranbacteria bacterium RIFOXYA1_FULL_44_7]OGI32866.1 MAG: protein-export membrane protein SecF [Candidatus Moranbacteria bacterium RIFOXYC1_FULL_44_13]OGI37347.1 MAG: protein-export membrane protein SecF [Candidatus Moranbacteria bacterium RIFOXYD1_FULL_44_12]